MSIEAAGLIAALLWGPTALWLIFRVVRGPGSQRPEAFADRNDQARLVPEARLLDYWVCKDCRSVNHEGANHCYSCGIDRVPVERVKPPEPVTPDPVPIGTGWVPVMDPAPEPRASVPVAAMAARGGSRPRSRRWNGSSAAGGFADASVAAHMDWPVLDTVVPPPPLAPATAASGIAATALRMGLPPPQSAVPPVCPFLWFEKDPARRCGYPDARNMCHAVGKSMPITWRLGRAGGGPSVAIGSDHQSAMCLTANHKQCERYPQPALPVAPA